MRRISTASRLALTSSTFALAAGVSAPAAAKAPPVETAAPVTNVSAQDVQNLPTNSTLPQQVAANNAASGSGGAITVTGSRIRRPNLESVVPVTSVQGEQFFQRGGTALGDALNDLPQLRSTFAQQNPGSGIGIAGLNLLDLRGLGTKRTLVLVNGRRHVAADILNTASSPDINTISTDLIDRVDIVTGGNSAVYGSDAIAGVVNFILKRNFEGAQVRAQGSEAWAGFGTSYFLSAMYGKNFADGRANVTIQGEYNHDQRVFGSDIPWYRHVDAFVVSDVDGGLLPSQHNSDGFPDRVLVRDVRSSTISTFGLVPITQQNSIAACGTGLGASNGGPTTVGGTAFSCTYVFQPDGSLVAQTGTRAGTGPNATVIGGNGQTTREGQQLSVFPENKRINLNLLAHYTISDAFEPFLEAKWVRVDSTGNNSGPSFMQGAQFDFRERPRLDNPFLNPDARATIASALIASGCNPGLNNTCATAVDTVNLTSVGGPSQGINGRLSAADIAMINAGTYRFANFRRLQDFGLRDEVFRRDTYRLVGGFRGNFNTDWSYELSANYGQFDQHTTAKGYVDRQKFMLAMDAARDPITGQIKCRSQIPGLLDTSAYAPYFVSNTDPRKPIFAARLAADIAACVPYNPFGGADNSASVAYFGAPGFKTARMTQFDVLGFVNGDSSQLFSLPGGPIGFVLGGEYRRETAFYHEDPLVDTPGGGISITNEVDVGNFDPPAFHVSEAFAEINVPILRDMPFFHELSLSGAGRYSRYQAPIKGVWTYNFGGEWAPVRDIRFRGNYGKSVRAPNLAETGFPVVPNFSNGFVDPCSATGLAARATRLAPCQAALGPLLPNVREAGTAGFSLGILSGSNPNLLPEVSHSLTLGGVFQPRFLPGFSLSADYYNIKVDKVVANVLAQTIVNNCYDLAAGNLFCGLFQRVPAGGTGAAGETPGNVVFNSILQGPQNYAKRIRRGIDFNANYRARLAPKIVLDTSLIWVHGLQNSNYENVLDPTFENQLLGELGDPKDEGRLDADLKVGNVTFGYNMHYIGWQYISAAEDQISLPTACNVAGDPNSCPPLNADFATPLKFPVTTYHGFRIQWDTGPAFGTLKNIQVYAGVDNVFDRHPPLGITGTGTGPVATIGNAGIYDVFGRRFFGGIKVRY